MSLSSSSLIRAVGVSCVILAVVSVLALGAKELRHWGASTPDVERMGAEHHVFCLEYCGTMELVEVQTSFEAQDGLVRLASIQCVCDTTLIDWE